MAITKNIVDMMGGTITVKSEEGQGSEFTVNLTFKLCGEAKSYEKIEQLQGLKVLVADDDTDTCLSTSGMLTELGMRSEWTVSGKEAVIRAKHSMEMGDEFYAYIIDWLMPDMNGIETVRRIRRVIGDSSPIIILTAYDWSDIEEEAKEAGVTAFCEKPLFMSQLRELLTNPVPKTKEPEKREWIYNGKRILLVEDNELNQEIAQTILEDAGFMVETANDGVEALKVLDNQEVSLVVSDVVMPRMDGFELCKLIKSKLDYSHIPVILLTAKTNIQSKIEGLELGADAYIEKPFSVGYLQACIANLINSREKLRQAFAQSPFVAANTMALTKADEEFMKKLNEIIQNNLHNPDFSMDDIVDSLNMSRSNFYRKIKGVLDLSPNEYLRLERLKRAAQLLKEGNGRVNEICYMVGFNSPSYFSKCFQKQFGVLPKEFAG